MTTENNTDGKNSIDCDKFKPLIDYYGDIKPSCGDLFTLCPVGLGVSCSMARHGKGGACSAVSSGFWTVEASCTMRVNFKAAHDHYNRSYYNYKRCITQL